MHVQQRHGRPLVAAVSHCSLKKKLSFSQSHRCYAPLRVSPDVLLDHACLQAVDTAAEGQALCSAQWNGAAMTEWRKNLESESFSLQREPVSIVALHASLPAAP
jgi:hypothetical protein